MNSVFFTGRHTDRVLPLVIVAAGVLLLLALSMAAMTDSSDASSSGTTGSCDWILTDDGTLTISGYGDMGNYSDSSRAPWGTAIKSVTIRDGVSSIGKYAFYRCILLTSVAVPSSVATIGDNAFGDCTALEQIVVDAKNMYYCSADGVLYSKDMKTLVRCPIGRSTSSFNIPSTVTYIGVHAFEGCTSLTSLIIPNSVTTIGEQAFIRCTSLTSVAIPGSVATIGREAFIRCTSIESIAIGDGVTSIGAAAFENCTSLTSLIIPNTVTTIGEYAFAYCTSLTSIDIGRISGFVGTYAFNLGTYAQKVTCNVWGCPSGFLDPFSNENTTFIYRTEARYTLTIHYTGYSEAIPDHIEKVTSGTYYSVSSPVKSGYTADPATVTGTMPSHDVTVTVTYSQAGSDNTLIIAAGAVVAALSVAGIAVFLYKTGRIGGARSR